MKHIRKSVIAMLLVFGVGFACMAQQNPVRERTAKIGKVSYDAYTLRTQNNPRQALAMIEEELATEIPPFDTEDPSKVDDSWRLYKNLTAMYDQAASCAYDGGFWEKAVDYYRKAGETIKEASEKSIVAFMPFKKRYEDVRTFIQATLDSNADAIKELNAKDEKDYTDADREAKQKLDKWQEDLDGVEKNIKYFDDFIANTEIDVKKYNPDPPHEDALLQGIAEEQERIDTYKGGAGNKAKYVEGIVANYATYLRGWEDSQKIHFVYRLMALSPDSKSAPIWLAMLQGNATEAELKRAIQASRAPARR
ncbi:MAG: hypothetical protein FWG02_04050 [Holophagaceae bacterium]|nr:hypothetical protein [Holophagaceae bacterium]